MNEIKYNLPILYLKNIEDFIARSQEDVFWWFSKQFGYGKSKFTFSAISKDKDTILYYHLSFPESNLFDIKDEKLNKLFVEMPSWKKIVEANKKLTEGKLKENEI